MTALVLDVLRAVRDRLPWFVTPRRWREIVDDFGHRVATEASMAARIEGLRVAQLEANKRLVAIEKAAKKFAANAPKSSAKKSAPRRKPHA